MDAIVRNGYVVFYRGMRYEAGSYLPASIVQEVLKDQSWKIEVINGEQKGKESTESKETAEATSGDWKEGQEVRDIVSDKMIKKSKTR